MKNTVISRIINRMIPILDNEQIAELKICLQISLSDVEITQKKNEIITYDDSMGIRNKCMIQRFLDSKVAAGKSINTAKTYSNQLRLFSGEVAKPLDRVDEDDIKLFLYKYQTSRGNKLSTVKTMYSCLSSFYGWMRKNRFIQSNPMELVESVKVQKTIKRPFSDEEVTRLKDACSNDRDRAIVDFLESSMCRVGELVKLNREDITFTDRECIALGKGNKERTLYFNGETKLHLQKYLSERQDNNPAIFVNRSRPYSRMSIRSVQRLLERIGKKAAVPNVHPHRFRRTGATRCLSAGMPVEELQRVLGHENINTTLIYTHIQKKKIRQSYDKVMTW